MLYLAAGVVLWVVAWAVSCPDTYPLVTALICDSWHSDAAVVCTVGGLWCLLCGIESEVLNGHLSD